MPAELKRLTRADLDEVARLHCAAFPGAALSRLGPRVVAQYYRWLLEGPHDADAWGAYAGDELAGFCFSGVWRGAEAGFVRNRWPHLAGAILRRPWLAWSPFFRTRLRLGLRLLFSRPRPPAPTPAPAREHYGIQSIATSPARRGGGHGRLLMQRAEECARTRGFRSIFLSVHADNQVAIGFYTRLGWHKTLTNGVWNQGMTRHLN